VAIEAVIFDFCQTLVDSAEGFRSAEKAAQKKIFADLALTDWDGFLTVYRRIRTEFHDRSCFSRLTAWLEVYWQYCRDADQHQLRQWEADYWDTVTDKTVIFPETMDVLGRLADRYQLALVSNTEAQAGSDDHPVKHLPDLQALFAAIVIAGEDDVPTKPDPLAFTTCVQELALPPERCVYVGDDWRRDICGARKAGLKAVWIKHASVQRHWLEVETDVPVITSLEPLLDLPALLGDGR